MELTYLPKKDLLSTLQKWSDRSFDFIVVAASGLPIFDTKEIAALLDQCARVLRDDGMLFVQGYPEILPEMAVYLSGVLTFRYWIAIESAMRNEKRAVPSNHAAVLLYSKSIDVLRIKRLRFPHRHCAFCNRPLKDWGGKSHLMHPQGYVISDIWKDLPKTDNYHYLSLPVLETILKLIDFGHKTTKGLIFPKEALWLNEISPPRMASASLYRTEPLVHYGSQANGIDSSSLDVVSRGDVLEVLRRYPSNSVDLAFADPPYNLDKSYNIYDDEREGTRYIEWCNSWLREYVRVLKPNGSLYVVNLPKWAIHHAAFLNRHLFFQNWIAWDALSEPRGKLMPAHYALLFYTKHPTSFTFNYNEVGEIDSRAFCLRGSCIRKRKQQGVDIKVPLTDIWWDIHRIKHRRDRDTHPCQLPEQLLERIILLSSNQGDVVLDGLCGTGTTAVVAKCLGRRYIAIDIDENYVNITKDKLKQLTETGYIAKRPRKKPKKRITKKELQMDLRALAVRLGRLPTAEDVKKLSKYKIEDFEEAFPSWGKALKAAKLELELVSDEGF